MREEKKVPEQEKFDSPQKASPEPPKRESLSPEGRELDMNFLIDKYRVKAHP